LEYVVFDFEFLGVFVLWVCYVWFWIFWVCVWFWIFLDMFLILNFLGEKKNPEFFF